MYTIVVDESERRRQFENRINEGKRHCRIGKVYLKPPRHWRKSELLKGQPIYPSYPLINDFKPKGN